jgi:hypothetical protein
MYFKEIINSEEDNKRSFSHDAVLLAGKVESRQWRPSLLGILVDWTRP